MHLAAVCSLTLASEMQPPGSERRHACHPCVCASREREEAAEALRAARNEAALGPLREGAQAGGAGRGGAGEAAFMSRVEGPLQDIVHHVLRVLELQPHDREPWAVEVLRKLQVSLMHNG